MTPMRAGREAERAEDWDRAVVEYQKALRETPDDFSARHALERVKIRASLAHFSRGRRLAGSGKLDEAAVELQIALELNPASGDIERLLRDVRLQLRNKMLVATEGHTRLESIIDQARDLGPVGSTCRAR